MSFDFYLADLIPYFFSFYAKSNFTPTHDCLLFLGSFLQALRLSFAKSLQCSRCAASSIPARPPAQPYFVRCSPVPFSVFPSSPFGLNFFVLLDLLEFLCKQIFNAFADLVVV